MQAQDSARPELGAEKRERVQSALDIARDLAERVNQELGDYSAYSSAEDAIQSAEAAIAIELDT